MTTEKIIAVAEMYRRQFEDKNIPKRPMDPNRTFKSLSEEEALAHVHHLIDGLVEMAKDPTKRRKTGSHLTAVQMILSYSGWYTLDELKSHNRSDPSEKSEKPT